MTKRDIGDTELPQCIAAGICRMACLLMFLLPLGVGVALWLVVNAGRAA